ncbi:phosphoenolpyruvate--protein phosphotransferase [Nocardia camponoti]|uniref:Phosphoenolpyruvate-protein phosphotransferase n=1 Tax=Nocardia camponoti TaxID=1616106 RepID=A0A917VBY9_9NOCA|nr:phosphoenolpyruvate--protein phosphotransferase [Nocardia camponoti]GGK61246.1 phosphoenolpyruvate-protein phosphotransferase [Nocardia camponoti]
MTEQVIRGLGVSPGVVVGPWLRFGNAATTSADDPVSGPVDQELARAKSALAEVADDMTARAAKVDGVAAEILKTSSMMARDPGIVAAVEKHLLAGTPTAHAVHLAFDGFADKLSALGGYMAERATDLRDIGGRTVAVLLGEPLPGIPAPGYPFVLVARDLAPADTAMLGDSDVIGLLTSEGGPTSHTAILAKALGLPAVVSCPDLDALVDGEPVLVDGTTGEVVIAPTQARQDAAREQAAADAVRLQAATGPGHTADGTPVQLLVNIGTVDDAVATGPLDSEGVGLFRTEFMYLGKTTEPTLEEQTASYTTVFEQFAGRKVVVRTLDAGSDKPLPFLDLGTEENPALGVRGLRIGTVFPETLATQLTALARAADATGADLWVMAPMVATVDEAANFAELARGVGLRKVGAMIEIPAAALRAADLLTHLDFVSIGTNDLSQYTLAVDRMAGSLAPLLDPWQPPLLDLIAMVGAAGAMHGKPVGVCGEAGSDPSLAPVLVGLGVTSLSMSAPALPAVRVALADVSIEQCRAAADAASAAANPTAARAAAARIVGRG